MRIFICCISLSFATLAAAPPDPPLHQRDSGLRTALDGRTTAQPGAWERIQDPIDRSSGRIEDEQTYEVRRLNRERDERFERVVPQREFERFEEERERRLRLDDRKQRQQNDKQRHRAELDLREYELFINSGLSTMSLQARVDEQALRRAKARRDEQLIDAENERIEGQRQRPNERETIDQTHQQRMREIRQQYERERSRILGWESAATTAPTTQP